MGLKNYFMLFFNLKEKPRGTDFFFLLLKRKGAQLFFS